MPADLVLTNANVITMNPAKPSASLVAIKDNKVWLVGDNGQLGGARGAKTKLIDCQGRAVVPGFKDSRLDVSD